MLKFITGNKGKLGEVKKILAPIKVTQLDIDLDEIQGLDHNDIIRHKLNEAFKHSSGPFLIDDTSTAFSCFKYQLPGTFMKWFLDVLKPAGLYNLAKKMGDTKAEMQTILAYADNKKRVYFFKAKVKGKIVSPRLMGKSGFGVDPIFVPKGSTKTLSQLKAEGGYELSARYKVGIKFKKFLLKK